MKLYYSLVFILSFLAAKPCYAQRIIATNNSSIHDAKLVILAEFHQEELMPIYEQRLIEKLYKEDGLTDLVLEAGKAAAYLLNEYLATGDSAIFNFFPLFGKGDKDYFKQLRQYRLPSGKPITIHGIDFERITIVPALKMILTKTGNTKNKLYKYLSTLPDTLININTYDNMIVERSAIIQKCIKIYEADKTYYSAIYDDGYTVKEICENKALETKWQKRFSAMERNLSMLYKGGTHKYLLIVGLSHVNCPNPLCKTPIYNELYKTHRLSEGDIITITSIIKDCEVHAMYRDKQIISVGSSKIILNQPTLIDSL